MKSMRVYRTALPLLLLFWGIWADAQTGGGAGRGDAYTHADDLCLSDDTLRWTGSSSSNWSDPGNWQTNVVPQGGDYVILPNAGFAPEVDGVFSVCALEIDSFVVLRIRSSNCLAVGSRIINKGEVFIEDEACLLQAGAEDRNVNQGNYQIYRRTTYLNQRAYVYWSSPIAGESMLRVFGDSSSAPTNSLDWYQYNPGSGWQSVGPSNSVMQAGRGYITTPEPINSPNLQPITETRVFAGKQIFNGPIAYHAGATLDSSHYVLPGNPYPSAISADAFIETNTDLSGTVYFWNHVTYNNNVPISGDYASYNLTGGVAVAERGNGSELPQGFIASNQGFYDSGGQAYYHSPKCYGTL